MHRNKVSLMPFLFLPVSNSVNTGIAFSFGKSDETGVKRKSLDASSINRCYFIDSEIDGVGKVAVPLNK